MQPNFITDGINFMTQQKKRKQLILTNNKNISTYRFEPIQRLQPNFITDGIRNFMAQQKQRKQLILTDNKNISTYRFEPIQRLQPNFMTDGIRNFMYTKHNKDNAKLRIFSFILQRQRIQPNFLNDSIKTFIHTKELNTHTTRTTKFCSIHIQTPQEIGRFRTFHPSQILYILSTTKNLYLAC